jgi:hypothetical protein
MRRRRTEVSRKMNTSGMARMRVKVLVSKRLRLKGGEALEMAGEVKFRGIEFVIKLEIFIKCLKAHAVS